MLSKFRATMMTVQLATMAAASAAQAEEYVDAKAGFRVTIPAGWTRNKDIDDDELVVQSPNTETTFGYCFVHTVPLPGTENVSQAEIDRRLAGKFSASFWQKYFEADFKNVVIESSGEKTQNGRTTYYAVAAYKDIRRVFKSKVAEHYVPGRAHHLTCTAYVETYSREQAAFETFFDSFVPIVSAPTPSPRT